MAKPKHRTKAGKAIRKQLEVDVLCNLGSSRYYAFTISCLIRRYWKSREIAPYIPRNFPIWVIIPKLDFLKVMI